MQVRVINPHDEPLQYESAGACGFDFRALEEVTFQPKEFRLVETGIVVEVPAGYVLQICPRSSTFKKHGLMQVNSVGIIDTDYCGDGDTIKFAYINMLDTPMTIEKGTRIGQGVLMPILRPEFVEVDTM